MSPYCHIAYFTHRINFSSQVSSLLAYKRPLIKLTVFSVSVYSVYPTTRLFWFSQPRPIPSFSQNKLSSRYWLTHFFLTYPSVIFGHFSLANILSLVQNKLPSLYWLINVILFTTDLALHSYLHWLIHPVYTTQSYSNQRSLQFFFYQLMPLFLP